MKIIITICAFIFSTNVFAQILDVKFDVSFGFNAGKIRSYDSIIDVRNHLGSDFRSGGVNNFIFNLEEKTVYFFFKGQYIDSCTILNSYYKNGMYYISMLDQERSTKKRVVSKVIINPNFNNTKYPYFTSYFISSVDGSTNGFIAPKELAVLEDDE